MSYTNIVQGLGVTHEAAKYQYTILKQICNHIPAHLVPKLARSAYLGYPRSKVSL
jgi:hypothetical protein